MIAWAVKGFFGTTSSKEFLLDVVARFILSFPTATRLPWTVEERETALIDDREPYELKEMARNLPSLPWGHSDTKLANFVDTGIRKINSRRNKDSLMQSEDALFEATRWHLYRRAYAERTPDNITEEYVQVLLETENELLTHKKSSGDIRSKAKRMAEYMQTEFVIYTDIEGYAEWSKARRASYMREYRRRKGADDMGRTEHMKKVHKNRNAKAQAKIRGVLEDMFVREQIHFKNGKIRIGEVAKLVNMTAETVSKHMKKLSLNH